MWILQGLRCEDGELEGSPGDENRNGFISDPN